MKNIRYGKNKHNRTRSSLFIQRKTPSVNITAMRYQNDVMRSVLPHILNILGKMLAQVYASCHAARSNACSPIDHLLDLLKRKVCAQPLQLNLS